MHYKRLLPVLMLGSLTIACNRNNGNATITVDTLLTDAAETEALLKNTDLDFEGVLPCSDCPGITTSLHLNRDSMTYVLTEIYAGKADSVFNTAGTFKMIAGIDSVSQVVELITADGSGSRFFEIQGDSVVVSLSSTATRIPGDASQKLRRK